MHSDDRSPEVGDPRLLKPGWAGVLGLDEALYIQACLVRDATLRRRWGIRHKIPPLTVIAEKAYPEDPTAARRHIRAEQARARRRRHSEDDM